MPHLIIQNGNGIPHKHDLEGERTTIGRHPESSVVVMDASVSTHHAEIATTDGEFFLRDLDSMNGTTLNGRPVVNSPLKYGDTIQFGRVQAQFVERPPEVEKASQPLPENDPGPEVKHEVKNLKSISDSLRHSAAKVATGIGVAARLAALKAKIEKLKRVDLNAAYYALGKKCYELGLHREQFVPQFEAIVALGNLIQEKSKTAPTPANETTKEKMMRVGATAVASTEAAALKLKLKHLLTELGRLVMDSDPVDAPLQGERATVGRLKEELHTSELAAEELMQQLKNASASKGSRALWAGGAALCVLILSFVLFRSSHHRFAFTYIDSPRQINHSETVERLYADPVTYFDKPVAVKGVIHAASGSGLEEDYQEGEFYSFVIRSENSATEGHLAAFFSRKNGSRLFDYVSKFGDSGTSGVFVVNINRHTKQTSGNYRFRNPFWQYIECELVGYGPSLKAINATISANGNTSGSEGHAKGLNVIPVLQTDDAHHQKKQSGSTGKKVQWLFKCPTCGRTSTITESLSETASRIDDLRASMEPRRPTCPNDGTRMSIDDFEIVDN